MAEEGHHKHRGHHGDKAEQPPMLSDATIKSQGSVEEEIKRHKSHEHIAELAHLGAGAYTLYQHHEGKKNPGSEKGHGWETKIGTAAALGSGGYAIYEHHEVHKLEHPKDEKHEDKHHGKHHGKHGDKKE